MLTNIFSFTSLLLLSENKQTCQLIVLRRVPTKMVKIADLVRKFPAYGARNFDDLTK
jgi:hypothetical protein